MSNVFLGEPPANIKEWIEKTYLTIYKVQTTSSYKNTGIYSAERADTSKSVKIDWGDGIVETIDGDISQKSHTYGSVGEFTVKVSNIKTFAASANNSAWYNTTSQNRYTLKEFVNLNKAVTSIGSHAFFCCSGLTSVTIGNSVTSIGDYAFYNCSGLTSVTIGNSVESIGSHAFFCCSGLTSVTIGNSVTSIGDSAFYKCSGLMSVTIGNGVMSIGSDAFSWCSGLTSVTIPDGVTSIGERAFFGCNTLVEMTFEGMDCETVKSNALGWGIGINDDYSKHLVVCYCTDGVVVINDVSQSSDAAEPTLVKYQGDEDWTEIMIKGKLTASAIPGIQDVDQIKIGEGVTAIGAAAFRADYQFCNISNVEFPSSLKKIGNAAFMGNLNLGEITFPNNLKTISDYAFTDCIGIGHASESAKTINIPDSVTSIGLVAFRNCDMENIHIGTGIESIGWGAFSYCDSLTSVVFSCKTMFEIQNMDNYPWGIEDTSIIHGS